MADGEKKEEDGNIKIWISPERKEIFRWKIKHFHSSRRAIIWWKIKICKKIADTRNSKTKNLFWKYLKTHHIQILFSQTPREVFKIVMFLKRDSDFHKLTTTVLKQYFPKLKPKVVN